MKKIILYFLIVIVIILSFVFEFGFVNKQMNIFSLRYSFVTKIENFSYPNKLLKSRTKYYWMDFKEYGSDLSWFESLEVNLTSNEIVLDIKAKYVQKIRLNELTLKDLSIFNLPSFNQYELYKILISDQDKEIISEQVKEFCENQSDKFLFEKGISKLIQF